MYPDPRTDDVSNKIWAIDDITPAILSEVRAENEQGGKSGEDDYDGAADNTNICGDWLPLWFEKISRV